jgi:shikimate kinase
MTSVTNSNSLSNGAALPISRSIVLVGMMGVGKSTVGKKLAETLDLKFADSDDEIEKAAGMTVAEIFARFGENDFRDGERRVIARLIENQPMVIATGGGAFINDTTRALIKERCLSVWIDADIDTLVQRVSRRNTRPLLIGKDPHVVLTELSQKRNPIYALADIKVRSDTAPHGNTVVQILEALKSCTR